MLGAGLSAEAQTVLHLSETASIAVLPDEIAGALRAEAIAPSAAEAQQKVNAVMADALQRAHRASGVVAATGAYTVWRTGPTPTDRQERWEAAQTLDLHASDGAALLTLAGELQQHGLATSELGWRVSERASETARQRATAEAVAKLRGRADAISGLLGLQFDAFKEVRLDSPARLPAMRTLSAATAGPAPTNPNVEPAQVEVTATVDADVLLKPR